MFSDDQFTLYAQEYMDTIFRVAFNYLKSRADADDITQNVLVKLYKANREFESDSHMKHWLIRVTVNVIGRATDIRSRLLKELGALTLCSVTLIATTQ